MAQRRLLLLVAPILEEPELQKSMATEADCRYLCSNLLSVHLPADGGGEREIVGNLEEIATLGAYLNVEEFLDVGLHLRLVCSNRQQNCELKGVVVDCNYDVSTGYYIDVKFSPGYRWSPELFKPKHLIRASTLLALPSGESSPEANCCERGTCPKDVISQLLQPEFPLTGRVRAVAREVAGLCGGMTESETVTCFGSLFGAGPECRLFTEFQHAYTSERLQGSLPQYKSLRAHVQGLVQLAGAVSPAIDHSEPGEVLDSWANPANLEES